MRQPVDHQPVLPVPLRRIEQAILQVRGHRVMLDADLAALYGVETGALVRAVKRNAYRFPEDFMSQLNPQQFDNLRCQIGTSSSWGGRRHPPYAFTEQGVAMLSSVRRSKRAAQVNVEIMRTFARTTTSSPTTGRRDSTTNADRPPTTRSAPSAVRFLPFANRKSTIEI
jgi:hypothetical protein